MGRFQRTPQAILCDIGGVLIENQWPHVVSLLSQGDAGLSDRVTATLTKLTPELDLGRLSFDRFCSDVVLGSKLTVSLPVATRIILYESQHLIEENFLYLEGLKASHRLRFIAVSNVCKEIASAQRHLFPLSRLFDDYTLSSELGISKPSRRFFEDAVRKANCLSSECLFLDDCADFVLASEKMGIQGIHIDSPGQLVPKLTEYFGPGRLT